MTTPPTNIAFGDAAQKSDHRPASASKKNAPLGVRNVDIAALRADGSIVIGQRKVPTLPLFDAAFSAFARGTPLQTENGPVAIEDLQPGDRVMTAEGTAAQITWIGSTTSVLSDTQSGGVLTRVMADSFGMNRPDSFLSLGPAARLLQTPPHLRAERGEKRVMSPARAFVDGVNVIEVTPPTPVHMFHLCLERHTAVIAGGLEIETYHPGLNPTRLLSHTLRSVFLSLFPHLSHVSEFGLMRYERAPEETDQTAA